MKFMLTRGTLRGVIDKSRDAPHWWVFALLALATRWTDNARPWSLILIHLLVPNCPLSSSLQRSNLLSALSIARCMPGGGQDVTPVGAKNYDDDDFVPIVYVFKKRELIPLKDWLRCLSWKKIPPLVPFPPLRRHIRSSVCCPPFFLNLTER